MNPPYKTLSGLPPNDILCRILKSGEVLLEDGSSRKLTSASSPAEIVAMHRFLSDNPPKVALEIGMAYGVSALTILSSMKNNGGGHLVSIDPYIKFDSARLSALRAIRESGLSQLHEHIHQPSELALPKLVADAVTADFVYIDGHHGFDHAFLDMFYADQLIPIGGVIAFDDSQWRGVHKAIKYLLKHREYIEIDVGLTRSYKSRNPLFAVIKRIEGRFGSSRYFRKTGDWAAPYNFFRSF